MAQMLPGSVLPWDIRSGQIRAIPAVTKGQTSADGIYAARNAGIEEVLSFFVEVAKAGFEASILLLAVRLTHVYTSTNGRCLIVSNALSLTRSLWGTRMLSIVTSGRASALISFLT